MEEQLKIMNFPLYTDTQKQYNDFELILKTIQNKSLETIKLISQYYQTTLKILLK